MKEIWKQTMENNNYFISNFGRIKSKNHFVKHSKGGLRKVKGRFLKPIKWSNGYLFIFLGSEKAYSVHRLVAKYFIDNPLNKPCVNHLDGNKQNNNIKNLEWCTYSENERYSYKFLGKKPSKTGLGIHGLDKPQAKQVALIDIDGNIKEVFESAYHASKKIKNTIISKINSVCCGIQKTHRGYIFKRISKRAFLNYVKRRQKPHDLLV